MSRDWRVEEVRAALARVADPELDQSVIDLGFVERIAVEDDSVDVDYRLPTAWCSANFAWIMSEDMRSEIASLGWVRNVRIRLLDHFAAGRINAAIAAGKQFADAFGIDAGGDLSGLRETFRQKAYLGRMWAAIDAFRKSGRSDRDLLALSVDELTTLAGDDGLADVLSRYLDLRKIYGGPADGDEPAFRTIDGQSIEPAGLGAFLRDIRMTCRGVEANGEMCRIFLQARRAVPLTGAATPPAPASSER